MRPSRETAVREKCPTSLPAKPLTALVLFNLLGDPRLTEGIKFIVLEIKKNFENYKKDTTLACLEGLKAHVKLLSLGESVETCVNMETDQMELCLNFCFLFDITYVRLNYSINNSTWRHQVFNDLFIIINSTRLY